VCSRVEIQKVDAQAVVLCSAIAKKADQSESGVSDAVDGPGNAVV
jgi:hypothetical protein